MAVLWESDRIHAIISRFVHVDLKKGTGFCINSVHC